MLTDHMGVVRGLADFKGKAVVLFFGYTQCPDVCPTTMAELARAMKKLGKAAEDVQVLFVTLDPEHDSPSALKQYLSGFNSQFLGLRGDDGAVRELVSEFKAFSQKRAEAPAGDQRGQHTIEHSSGVYIFDPRGQLRLYAKSSGDGGDAIARDLGELLKPAA
jgi:protein SCO1/2